MFITGAVPRMSNNFEIQQLSTSDHTTDKQLLQKDRYPVFLCKVTVTMSDLPSVGHH